MDSPLGAPTCPFVSVEHSPHSSHVSPPDVTAVRPEAVRTHSSVAFWSCCQTQTSAGFIDSNTTSTGNDLNLFNVFYVSVPENTPVNVTAKPNGTEVLLMWAEPPGKLNGELQGYMVEYSTPGTPQVGPEHKHNTTKDTTFSEKLQRGS